MRLKILKIKNFRAYKNEIEISFDNLTALIGRNDVGKTTILDALGIFLGTNFVNMILEINVYMQEKMMML